MAAAAIKIASAAQGDNAKKKKPSHSATHPEDEEKRAENDLKKIEEAMAFPTTGILKYQRQVRSGASGSRSRRAALLAEEGGLHGESVAARRRLLGLWRGPAHPRRSLRSSIEACPIAY